MPLDVSRETSEKLQAYAALLEKWQKSINLVSDSTLMEIESRHFADSLKLLPFLRDSDRTVFDFGSGAGFPTMILAMARPDLDVHLFESDTKKCAFLRTVSRETKTPVTVHEGRIEAQRGLDAVPDVIAARAFAALVDILDYTAPWFEKSPSLRLLLHKGAHVDDEILIAQEKHEFIYEKHESGDGCILVVRC